MKKRLYALTPMVIALGLPAGLATATPFDWSGTYYGAAMGYTSTNSAVGTDYRNDGASPAKGWVNGIFQTNIYNSINTFSHTNHFSNHTTNTLHPYNWLSSHKKHKEQASGTILIGKNSQTDEFVIGSELKMSFGNFGSSTTNVANTSGTKDTTDFEGPRTFNFTNYDDAITGIDTSIAQTNIAPGVTLEYSATYNETIQQKDTLHFTNMNALIGRAGYSFGKVLISATGGLAHAYVTYKTDTIVNASTTGFVLSDSVTYDFEGQSNNSFTGKHSKNMLGPRLGMSLEWAWTDTLALRLDSEYYYLGHISVSAQSNGVAYDMHAKVSGYTASFGFTKKI